MAWWLKGCRSHPNKQTRRENPSTGCIPHIDWTCWRGARWLWNIRKRTTKCSGNALLVPGLCFISFACIPERYCYDDCFERKLVEINAFIQEVTCCGRNFWQQLEDKSAQVFNKACFQTMWIKEDGFTRFQAHQRNVMRPVEKRRRHLWQWAIANQGFSHIISVRIRNKSEVKCCGSDGRNSADGAKLFQTHWLNRSILNGSNDHD